MKNLHSLLLLVCAAGATAWSAPAPAAKPNIILCMADDQGWGDMSYNGHPVIKTPNFDKLAKEGLRFDRFYAAAPVCSPTRGSVLTGRHPNRFGCFSWGYSLRPQESTIAAELKKAGYVTGHFGKWHLGTVYKDSPVNPGAFGFDVWISAPNFFDNDPILSRQGKASQFKGESSMVTVDLALEFIAEKARSPQPFLAVVWFGSPHAPHIAAAEDRAVYQDEKPALQNFYGEVTGMDRAFGKLRDGLVKLGLRNNTVLWYCSDNGGLPRIGASGGRGNKSAIYEGGLRVPALLEWPATIKEARTIPMPCSTVDIYPTLLEIAGARLSHKRPLDGISLLPVLTGTVSARTRPLGFWQHPSRGLQVKTDESMKELLDLQAKGEEVTDPERLLANAAAITTQYPENTFPGHAAWLDWPWKLHRIQAQDRKLDYELYNLAEDPGEARNRIGQESPRAKAMQGQLEDWLGSVTRSLNGKDYQ